MVARGTIVLDAGNQTLNLTKELVNIRTGVVNKNLPGLNSAASWQAAIFGRGREITLEGWYAGTQQEIEIFLDYFEDWVNKNLSFQETGKYYPLHHHENKASGTQNHYWNVLCTEFQYEYDEETPSRIVFVMTLNEGTKVGAYSAVSGES